MSTDQPKRPARSWRQDAPAATKAGSEAQRAWRKEAATVAATPGRWKRRTKFGLVSASVLAAVGLLVLIAYLLRPQKPVGLILVGAGYETNLALAHNVYGREGLKRLMEFAEGDRSAFFWGSGGFNLKHPPKELRIDDSSWDAGLNDVKEKAIIVFLALHGGVDKDGPYLLAQDADPYLPDAKGRDKLRLEKVLERLKQLPDKQKVLILDASQQSANAPWNMFHNDFVRGLKKLEPAIEAVPQLVVLCASDEDQRSWASEEWRSTIFAHYVGEALRGAADFDHNRDIDGLELHRYVLANVQRWVRENRNALQTPILLGGSDRESRAEGMSLGVVDQAYEAPDPTETERFTVPTELAKAWQRFHELERRLPPPYAYAPHLWRKYQDTLLRYEQLVRAGDRTVAAELGSRLQWMEGELNPPLKFAARSTQNTLAMPAALGAAAVKSGEQVAAQFDKLWIAPAAEVQGEWEKVQKWAESQGWSKEALRLRLGELLLDRVADEPDRAMKKGRELLTLVEGTTPVRPTEVHFFVMLNRHLGQPRPPAADLKLAIQVRRRAEQAALAISPGTHPYSELVFPWIQQKTEEADQQRRLGEDLLFASDSKAWSEGRALLSKADTLYRATQADAEAVRSAVHTRDQVLASLPYYAQWLARRRPSDENEIRVQTVEKLWADVHQLADSLQSPSVDRLAVLIEKTAAIRSGFKGLEDSYDRDCSQLTAVLQSDWREVDNLLAVPRVNPEKPSLRLELLEKTRQISRDFHLKDAMSVGDTAPASEAQKQQNSDMARQTACAQGRVSLATLGEGPFAEAKPGTESSFSYLQRQIVNAGVEQKWHTSLTQAADYVGEHWRRLPAKIKSLSESGRKSGPAQAAADLQKAERLARAVEGAAAATALSTAANPVEEGRNIRLHDLLLWQAGRTIRDHWFAEDPNGEAYYLTAGRIYVEDAIKLIGGDRDDLDPSQKRERLAQAEKVRAELDKPVRLAINGPKERQVTSEADVRFDYLLQAPKNLPPGYPIIWVNPGESLKPSSEEAGRRTVVRDFAAEQRPPSANHAVVFVPVATGKSDNSANPLTVKQEKEVLRGVFRGQELRWETHVHFQPVADTIYTRRRFPAEAGIAVRVEPAIDEKFGPNRGALTIVLDCSGSMGPFIEVGAARTQAFANPEVRFNQATRALEEVLGRVPDGITVSLWVFGQRINALGDLRPGDLERTIKQIRPPSEWKKDQLEDVMSKVRYPAIDPYHDTPLVAAMVKAKADLVGKPGFKTLLVITDGMDSEFAKEQARKPAGEQQTIGEFLKANLDDDSGIVVNVVGFQLSKAKQENEGESEEEKTRKQFEIIKEFKLPGKFHTVQDRANLARTLERAMRQRLRYRLETNSGQRVQPPGATEEGIDVSVIGAANMHWFLGLKPAFYRAFVQTDKQLNQRVNLDNGDLLLVNLKEHSGGHVFERGIFAEDYRWKIENRSREAGGWLFALLQNQLKPDRSLQMLATLENVRDRMPVEGHLQQAHPQEVWLEVKPSGVQTPVALRWSNAVGFPAPAWGIDVPGWPLRPETGTPSGSIVQAWWSEVPFPAAATLRRTSNPQTALEFKSLLDVRGDILLSDGSKVHVNGVQVEKRKIEGRAAESQCLVVRISHPQGKPVWVKIKPASEDTGSEHHFYAQAATYTGVFLDVSKAKAEDRIDTLEIYSVDAFKSSRTTHRVERLEIQPPEPNDDRPAGQKIGE